MRVVSICAVRELHSVNVDLVITQSRKDQPISLHAVVELCDILYGNEYMNVVNS